MYILQYVYIREYFLNVICLGGNNSLVDQALVALYGSALPSPVQSPLSVQHIKTVPLLVHS